MALNTFVNNMCDGSFVMKDATGTPLSAPIQFHNGDLSISGLQQKQRNVTGYEARGVITSVRHTTRLNPTLSFTAQMSGLTNASTGLASDAVMKAGYFSAGVSTLGANADVWAVTLVWTVEGSDFGGADSTLTATNCHCVLSVTEGDPNTFSVEATCFGTVTIA